MFARCVDVVVAARQPIFLWGLATMLHTEQDLNVVASCRDGVTCLRAIRDLVPGLAVLDSSLPDQGVFHVLKAVRSEKLGTRVIVLSGADDRSGEAGLASEGAHCVISDEVSPDALVRCVRQISFTQESPLPRSLVSLNRHDQDGSGLAGDPSIALTERERQIMRLVCEGLSNKDIGRQVKVSDGTVKVHLHHIYEKLAIHNRTTLAVLAAGIPNLQGLDGGRKVSDGRQAL